jgi:hypothetical protein
VDRGDSFLGRDPSRATFILATLNMVGPLKIKLKNGNSNRQIWAY